MKKNLQEKSGITLIALSVTIVVLTILAGVSIGASKGMKSNINRSKEITAMSDASKIQQAVIETYIKYRQMKNSTFLKGTKITYAEAKSIESNFKEIDSSICLKETLNYDEIEGIEDGIYYYKLTKSDLEALGLSNIDSKDEFVVNYSTGEVFNISNPKTALGNAVYLCGMEKKMMRELD